MAPARAARADAAGAAAESRQMRVAARRRARRVLVEVVCPCACAGLRATARAVARDACADEAAAAAPPTMKSSPPIDLPDARHHEAARHAIHLDGTRRARRPPRRARSTSSGPRSRSTTRRLVCRVEAYNLAFIPIPGSRRRRGGTGEHSALWHPDPFVIDPDVVRGPVRRAHHKLDRARVLPAAARRPRAAARPAAFPPPQLPDPGRCSMSQGATAARDPNSTARQRDEIVITALCTVAVPDSSMCALDADLRSASRPSSTTTGDERAARPPATPARRCSSASSCSTWTRSRLAQDQPDSASCTRRRRASDARHVLHRAKARPTAAAVHLAAQGATAARDLRHRSATAGVSSASWIGQRSARVDERHASLLAC